MNSLSEKAYRIAEEQYAMLGVSAEEAISRLKDIPISLHCWQGDDCGGFENPDNAPGGGLAVTGNHPGKARTPDELRADLDFAFSMIPGCHRVNIHAMYAETGGKKVERNELLPEHFSGWIDWAKDRNIGMDFNPTFFAHPLSASGFTLSSPDAAIRDFWISHGAACRRIGAAMGRALSSPCIVNFWIPDGFKDTPANRRAPRERLKASLDSIFEERFAPECCLDSLESKLFGIGSESFVTGSHEFYFGYASFNGIMICLDTGHFHPTETVADKISAMLPWIPGLLLHVSRGIRWDSDHVVVLTDEVRSIAEEIIRGNFTDRVRIGLDYFDASINRTAAWIIGARAFRKALLSALLEPAAILRELENSGDFTSRLALLERVKTLPMGAVWDRFCIESGSPTEDEWLNEVKKYEARVLSVRR